METRKKQAAEAVSEEGGRRGTSWGIAGAQAGGLKCARRKGRMSLGVLSGISTRCWLGKQLAGEGCPVFSQDAPPSFPCREPNGQSPEEDR